VPTSLDREELLRRCLSETGRAAGVPSRDAPRAPSQGSRLEPGALERATRALAEHLGPLARVLVARAAADAASEAELHERLAASVPEREREAFRARLRRRDGEP
jgi:hypothetical protein